MTQSPYLGQRFPFQAVLGGMRGGMMSEPYSGVISGLIVSAGTPTATACPVNVSAGSARLDGQLCTLSSNISNLNLSGNFAQDGDYRLLVYLRPRRVIPTVTQAPSGTGNAGDMRLQVQLRQHTQLGEFEEYVALWQYDQQWKRIDPIQMPPSDGQNNSPLNQVLPDIDSSCIATSPERPVYWPAAVIVGPNEGVNALRRNASILLAVITVTVTTSNGNTTRTASVQTYTEFERVPL